MSRYAGRVVGSLLSLRNAARAHVHRLGARIIFIAGRGGGEGWRGRENELTNLESAQLRSDKKRVTNVPVIARENRASSARRESAARSRATPPLPPTPPSKQTRVSNANVTIYDTAPSRISRAAENCSR